MREGEQVKKGKEKRGERGDDGREWVWSGQTGQGTDSDV